MGMDYVPVYEGEKDGERGPANLIRISTEKVQKLGVKTEAVNRRSLDRSICAGRIVPDERRIYAISPKFEGYVERLDVNVTGEPVWPRDSRCSRSTATWCPRRANTPWRLGVWSPSKNASEQARHDMQQVVDASLPRLKNRDIPDDEIEALVKTGQARRWPWL